MNGKTKPIIKLVMFKQLLALSADSINFSLGGRDYRLDLQALRDESSAGQDEEEEDLLAGCIDDIEGTVS